ncbi:MAG: MOSC domain-containing protein [Pseudomonadota bacterium]
MTDVDSVVAVTGKGLEGDRYSRAQGRFNRDQEGYRQVTLMNARFFANTSFKFSDSRRNIFVKDVELMWLIGREFQIGDAIFEGVSYCDPCNLPSKRAGISDSFMKTFEDCGGLIARVLKGGLLKVGDPVVPPPKGY